jgi:hypothetical protein
VAAARAPQRRGLTLAAAAIRATCLIYSRGVLGQGSRRAVALVAAQLAVGGLLAVGTPASAEGRTQVEDPFTFGDPAFCASKTPVEDFGISELPPLHEAPESGDLPFGPTTLSLQLSAGPVLPPGESVGFWLHSRNYGGRTPLDWGLRNRIRRVDAMGEAGKVVARSRMRIRTINAAKEVKLFLGPPPRPAFYRYEIEIADLGGKRLAKYDRYVRVERKFWDARLALNSAAFRPGEQVLSRVENFGTETIAFGEEFRLQGYRGGSWVPVEGPLPDGWLLWLGYLAPGMGGQCSALRLPDDFPPGQYRIVKEVGRSSWPKSDGSFLTAPFEVVS